jgi:hypothetical protein
MTDEAYVSDVSEELQKRAVEYVEALHRYLGPSRERKIALVKFDEMVMWSAAAIAVNGVRLTTDHNFGEKGETDDQNKA